MTSLREEFYKAFPNPLYDEMEMGSPDKADAVADWWINTLKERIEAERKKTEGHESICGHVSNDECEDCAFDAALDTITRLLE